MVTWPGKLCRSSIDLVEFGLNSIPKQNNVLCLAIVPNGTESEKIYQITWDDLRAAAVLLCSYKDCCVGGCDCGKIMELLSYSEVLAYIRSAKFLTEQLSSETAMWQLQGMGNFSKNALGINSNVCFPHATSILHYFVMHMQQVFRIIFVILLG